MRNISKHYFNIYLVRHGETDENKTGIIQGQMNTKLSEVGIEQARKLGLKYKDVKFTHVFSSDLLRAHQTATEILSSNDYPTSDIVIDKLLRERRFGEAEGKLRKDLVEIAAKQGLTTQEYTPKGAETTIEVFQRAVQFFENLCKEIRSCSSSNESPNSAANDYSTLNTKIENLSIEQQQNENQNLSCNKNNIYSTSSHAIASNNNNNNEEITFDRLHKSDSYTTELSSSCEHVNNQIGNSSSMIAIDNSIANTQIFAMSLENSLTVNNMINNESDLSIRMGCCNGGNGGNGLDLDSLSSSFTSSSSLDDIYFKNYHNQKSNSSDCSNAISINNNNSNKKSNKFEHETQSRNTETPSSGFCGDSCELSSPMEDTISEILVVSHGALIREMLKYFVFDLKCEVPVDHSQLKQVPTNTSVSKFTVYISPNENELPKLTCHLFHDKEHLLYTNLDTRTLCNM